MFVMPAPDILPLLPAPATAPEPSEAVLGELFDAIKLKLSAEPRLLVLDEAHKLFSSAALTHHVGLMGTSGRGKTMFRPHPPERERTKWVTVGGDDAVLAEWSSLSLTDWPLAWQGWFSTASNEPAPSIRIEDQSESGMLLAVDVAWTCQELQDRLAAQFPTLETHVSLEPY